MKTKTFVISVLYCMFLYCKPGLAGRRQLPIAKEDNSMDVTDFSVYYDLNTNATVKTMMPRPWYQPGWRMRLPFKGGQCDCDTFKCNCCAGIRIPQLGFDRQTCAVLNFNQSEGLLDFEVKMRRETVLNKTFSAANPPPFCIPIPIAGVPIPLLDLCIRLFDVTLNWNKMHVCMDWDTRMDKAPVVILHFDCMDLGAGGVSISKPGSSNESAPSSASETVQLNADVYDPVTELENITSSTISPNINNSSKYIYNISNY